MTDDELEDGRPRIAHLRPQRRVLFPKRFPPPLRHDAERV
jgi:hypothetical protein